MQFTITTIVALFAAATMAAPSAAIVDASLVVRDTSAVNALQAQAESFLAAKEANGCSRLKCIAALAPTVVSCAAALAEAGLNPIADAACIATLANSSINPPDSCKGC
ncbi:fungal calcium binding protein-domain-containing protein [Paraphoma chrysanthemicola]|uniref:Fungal calcium binding protein-domain-containing protein n=1 Tax=Paraphoma chrysanthemicola TaxID=798071 RepID=A0A8K0VTG5_9PLEO|nr:fungal calcium binding protein-domain-containing protein [Paraphoma chrysanthemicola]